MAKQSIREMLGEIKNGDNEHERWALLAQVLSLMCDALGVDQNFK